MRVEGRGACQRDPRATTELPALGCGRPPPSLFALGPFPIGGAPPIDDLVLLLFCPEQGGWHTGVRFEGRWLAHVSTEIEL